METEKLYIVKEIKEDLDYLFQKIENIHPNPYKYVHKKEILNKRKELEDGIKNTITKLEFWRKFASLLSSFQCNHIYS